MGLLKEVFRETRKDTKLMRTDPIVLDVGANLGYYSLLSAAFGFPVLSFEPQVHCHLFLKTAAVLRYYVSFCVLALQDPLHLTPLL
jgi:hypothetical protein